MKQISKSNLNEEIRKTEDLKNKIKIAKDNINASVTKLGGGNQKL